MKFRAVSAETKMNYLMWSIRKEITRENKYLQSLDYDPEPIMAVVKRYIDKWDPAHLLAIDAPEDEYDGEVRTITIFITQHVEDLSVEALSQKILEICSEAFEEDFLSEHAAREAASGIIESLRASHWLKG
ncbi:hypothetical protein [Paenibacillus aestuarii]|uniref:DUF1871 family protein n=1 Tax=Paenibacillus aestuarii TaxID=516965 RepID=A0ABW0K702_9BACL|nr:hypothetical protein [Paenibacillus aestuarii]